MSDKKYYWLKLKKDFFKRHDIRIVESMPNGKEYILFYLKLLVESVDHSGELRFSETIPYSEQMLATITNTNIDIVRAAMKLFIELKMIDLLEDNTIYMMEVEKMLGAETYWAEQKRNKKIGKSLENFQTISNESNQEIEIELDIDKELDTDKDNNLPFINEYIGETDIFQTIEKEFGRPLSSTEIDKISYWLNLVGEDYFTFALREALMYNKKSISYIDKILVSWKQKDYTLVQLQQGVQNER